MRPLELRDSQQPRPMGLDVALPSPPALGGFTGNLRNIFLLPGQSRRI